MASRPSKNYEFYQWVEVFANRKFRLDELPRVEGNPYVIVGGLAGAALVNLEKPWRAIRSAAGLDDVRIHDLRHSFASIAASDGMGLPIIGKMLGHSQPQTTARYAHLASDPVKAAAFVPTGAPNSLPAFARSLAPPHARALIHSMLFALPWALLALSQWVEQIRDFSHRASLPLALLPRYQVILTKLMCSLLLAGASRGLNVKRNDLREKCATWRSALCARSRPLLLLVIPPYLEDPQII